MNKAFHRVDHKFMFAVLGQLGFGENFVNWIRLIYRYASSCVKVNCFLTDKFPLERSVRQGCPLSVLLYSIVAEPFACMIKLRTGVEPLKVPGGGVSLIYQYADESTVTVRDLDGIDEVMDVFRIYGNSSGEMINVEKSCIMQFGDQKNITCKWNFDKKNQNIRIMGIMFGENDSEARNQSWTGVLNQMKQKLIVWGNRKLNIKVKVKVLNALILSKLLYRMNVLDMPDWVVKEVKELIEIFLWKTKIEIAYNNLLANYSEGGLGLMDIKTKLKAMRIKYIQNYLYTIATMYVTPFSGLF